MGYTNFCTIPLEDESHGLKEKAKIQSKKASRTAHICICKLLSTCGTLVQNVCTVLSSLLLSSMELPLSPSDSRVRNHYQAEFIGTLKNQQPRVVRSQLLRAGRYRRVHPPPKSKSSAESCQAVTKPSLTFSAFQVTFLSLPTKGKRQRAR